MSRGNQQDYYLQVFQRLYESQILGPDQSFQKFGKKYSFRQLLKNSCSMYESSDSHFSRTTTGT